ncbi:hypothetical protein SRB5_38100 [Streptomyces sp. RB5]|uniref:Tetratricopeptide repeat protein n=1 Tax=Streptomyces smaragdinus TaxID=2585196 RepID=A0A7K0CJJ7_9ACTN|nr:SAV_2336 N-terminal domain-related protein [Streptomyces smaragdinus]MQY13660.1 hypothetical protein [Streptomyces smaragdinus]
MPTRADGGPDQWLTAFLAALRGSGATPAAWEVADFLWLARHVRADTPVSAAPADSPDNQSPSDVLPPGPDTPAPAPAPTGPDAAAAFGLYVAGPGARDGAALPVRAPTAPPETALPGVRGLERALHALRGYHPPLPPVPGELDEPATAEQSARTGTVLPVHRPVRGRRTELLLLMDASATNTIWQDAFDALRLSCERLGVFRDVQALYLYDRPDGGLLVGTGPATEPGRLRPVEQYRDPAGRRVTLLLSDCVGPLWRSGRGHRLLREWLYDAPLAVVQPLPFRMWRRASLPAQPGVLRRRGTRPVLDFTSAGPAAFATPPAGALAVPVLAPDAGQLGGWARLVGGLGPETLSAAAAWLPPGDVSGARARTATAAARAEAGAEELLDAFRAVASPVALELAGCLAAAPLVLPVIRLVQAAMLPASGSAPLAEVLLGGLLHRLPDRDGLPGPRYEFRPGVRRLLLQSLDRGAATLVNKYVSDYVARRFGKGTRNFPALAVARLERTTPPAPDDPAEAEPDPAAEDELFAVVAAEVVRSYEPPGDPAPGIEEAERLLELWWTQRDRPSLERARRRAEAAVRTGGGERARLVLARVLRALSRTGPRTPEEAGALLERAEGLLEEGTAASMLERAAVQHELWELDRDPRHLLDAVETLTRGPAGPSRLDTRDEAERRTRLGRALLALARTEPDPAPRARQAAAELRAAEDAYTGRPGRERRLCSVLRDLTAALRLLDAPPAQTAPILQRALTAAGDDTRLRLACLTDMAQVYRDAGDYAAADRTYERAEPLAPADGWRRSELLAEWGEMRLVADGVTPGPEGVLREALATAPGVGPVVARLGLLLGRALLRRWQEERFLPDLYESCHQLERAARLAPDAPARAEAWRRLGRARAAFPERERSVDEARDAYRAAIEAAREAGPSSVEGARALHGLGELWQEAGRRGEALEAFRSAAAEWGRLGAEHGDLPWAEVTATRRRVAGLEGG